MTGDRVTTLAEIDDRPEISFVIPCYNEEENVRQICAAVIREGEAHTRSFEILLIDNASTDRTRDIIRDICAGEPRVRAIFNNRNYGQMRSPTHAIFQTDGDAIIGMCADFQDPPEMIGGFIAQWRAGAQIVLGQRRTEKASIFATTIRKIGYAFLRRFADYPIIPGATGFGLFARDVVDAVAQWHEPEPFFRGMVIESGYRVAVVPFDRPARAAGATKNNFKTLTDFALSAIAGSAKSLLRLPLILSVYMGLVSLGFFIATLVALFVDFPPGALALMAASFGIFAVLLFFFGLIGEQVRIISERTRNVPLVIEEVRLNFPESRRQPNRRPPPQATLQ